VPTEGNTAIVFRTGCKRQNLVVKENLFLPFYMKGLRKNFQGKVVGSMKWWIEGKGDG
jgi:hypothetical protein